MKLRRNDYLPSCLDEVRGSGTPRSKIVAFNIENSDENDTTRQRYCEIITSLLQGR